MIKKRRNGRDSCWVEWKDNLEIIWRLYCTYHNVGAPGRLEWRGHIRNLRWQRSGMFKYWCRHKGLHFPGELVLNSVKCLFLVQWSETSIIAQWARHPHWSWWGTCSIASDYLILDYLILSMFFFPPVQKRSYREYVALWCSESGIGSMHPVLCCPKAWLRPFVGAWTGTANHFISVSRSLMDLHVSCESV